MDDIDLEKIEKDVSTRITELKQIPIISKAFDILDNLPKYLKYHTKEHTENVLHEAILFGIIDNLPEKQLEKVAVAAVWHDVGYLIKQNNNEEESVQLFEKALPQFNLEYREDVKKMILDTKLKITKKGPEIIGGNPISAYLLDADVSNFGRIDFREKLNLIAEESNINLTNKVTKLKFLKFALSLLKNQDWNTEIARKLRQKQKIINIAKLEEEISILY
jgi:predicted metal-dependent HD superfamily phosphohydrolase